MAQLATVSCGGGDNGDSDSGCGGHRWDEMGLHTCDQLFILL